ncbi:MAG: DUF3137 domain-containing protein [Alphaproteobacteria bacterium]
MQDIIWEFQSYYDSSIRKDATRRRVFEWVSMALLSVFAMMIIFFIIDGLILHNEKTFADFWLLVKAGIFIAFLVFSLFKWSDRPHLKTPYMQALVEQYGALEYRPAPPNAFITQVVQALHIPPGNLVTEDWISGTYRSRKIALAEFKLYEDGGGKQTRQRPSNRGIVIRLTQEKSPSSLVPYIYINASRNIPKLSLVEELEKVRLESPRFEHHFDLYAKDQVIARTFMTPARMARWIDFADALAPAHVSMSLCDEAVLINLQGTSEFVDTQIAHQGTISFTALCDALADQLDRIFSVVDFVLEECA